MRIPSSPKPQSHSNSRIHLIPIIRLCSIRSSTPDGGSQGGGMDYSKVDDLSEQIRDCTNSKPIFPLLQVSAKILIGSTNTTNKLKDTILNSLHFFIFQPSFRF